MGARRRGGQAWFVVFSALATRCCPWKLAAKRPVQIAVGASPWRGGRSQTIAATATSVCGFGTCVWRTGDCNPVPLVARPRCTISSFALRPAAFKRSSESGIDCCIDQSKGESPLLIGAESAPRMPLREEPGIPDCSSATSTWNRAPCFCDRWD